MKLLNTYKNYDEEIHWLIEIPFKKGKLITLNNLSMQFEIYYFRTTNIMRWCGDKLTGKDNEIISNLRK